MTDWDDIGEPQEDDSTFIAVIGLACRFPGAADPAEFWANLINGRDTVTRFPSRPIAGSNGSGARYVPAGGFLERPEWFDAGYFGISPREARILDPQHRILMECAVEALESAGCDPDRHPGSIGMYAGGGDTSYAAILTAQLDKLPSVTGWEIRLATGTDFLSSRIAYKLGLTGPAVTVRAACATSLVAVHMAAQGLLAGDCDVALAGGVAVHVPAEPGHHTEGGILSADGTCRTFDAAAAGMVGGDGACLVVLKRLPEALADGDPIHAVMRGSAVNNDGAARVGYTAPSVEGQSAAIRAAQLVAGVPAETITYVEAHGTATPLGDPIEVAALTEAFRSGTGKRGFCGIGSVKTNIGHTDAAAGGAGFIKTVLALEHGLIPPSLHFTEPNPEIDFAGSPFEVVTATREWRPEGFPRRAGVSSFGMGGTNAHVVLEQPPPPRPPDPPSRPWRLLTLSARTPTALQAVTDRLADHLRAHPDLPLADVAWTLQTGRREHPYRRCAVVTGTADALRVLSGAEPERLMTSDGLPQRRPVAFVAPGSREPGREGVFVEDHALARQWVRWGVRPAAVVADGAEAPDHILIEIGAGDTPDQASGQASDQAAMLAAAGRLWLAGVPISWAGVHDGERRARLPLPTYPFERQRHVVEPDKPQEPAAQEGEEVPQADVRETVAGLFAEFLGLGEVDPDDSFFDLGGDSLIATQLLVRTRRLFPVDLGLRSMFEAPTAVEFAALIEDRMTPR